MEAAAAGDGGRDRDLGATPGRLRARPDRVPLHRHVDVAGAAGRRQDPRYRARRHRHRGGRHQPAGAGGAAGARAEAGDAAHALPEQQVDHRLPECLRRRGRARRGAEARAARLRQASPRRNGRSLRRRTTGRMSTACSSPAPTPRRSRPSPISSARLGKPVVNSNQAVLWGCLRKLGAALAPLPAMPELGRLMQHM